MTTPNGLLFQQRDLTDQTSQVSALMQLPVAVAIFNCPQSSIVNQTSLSCNLMQASIAETQEDELAKRLYAGSGHRLAAHSPPRSMRIGAAGKLLSALDTRAGAQSSGAQARYTNASAHQQQALIPKLLRKNGAATETDSTDLMSNKTRADTLRGAGTGAHSVASMRSAHAASSAIVLGDEPSSVYLRSNKMSPKRSTGSTLAAAASASHSPVRRHNGQMLYSADDSDSLTQSHHGAKLHSMNTGSTGSLHNTGNGSSRPERTAAAAVTAVAVDVTDDDGTFLMSLGLSDDQFDELFNSVNGNFLYLSQKPGMDATAYDLQVCISLTYKYL
jgi:hypothetical protein